MTCVVALKQDDKIYMGADNCVSDGNGICQIANEPSKLLKIHGALIGFSGISKNQNELLSVCTINNLSQATTEDEFANTFRRVLDNIKDNSSLILLSKGQSILWVGSGGWFKYNNYYAIGSGYQVALGALHANSKTRDPHKRIEAALEAAAAHCTSVKPPFIFDSI